KGDLNQVCVDRLPWLATASGKLGATSKAAASSQEAKRQQVVRQFQAWDDQRAIQNAPSLDLGLFLTRPATEFVQGVEAIQMVREYFAKTCSKFPQLKSVTTDFEQFIAAKTDLQVPSPGRKPSGLYPSAAILKFFPTSATLAIFRQVTKSLAEAK